MWLFLLDGARLFCSCFKMGLVDRGDVGDFVKTSDRCNCVTISLSLEGVYVQGEV